MPWEPGGTFQTWPTLCWPRIYLIYKGRHERFVISKKVFDVKVERKKAGV